MSFTSTAKNARQLEESGPFGRNRSVRYTSSTGRRASTRQGTTPSRTKENNAVSDFSRLFAKEQAAYPQTVLPTDVDAVPIESVPTECLLYGYAGKMSEWKVLSKFERAVAPGIICEDYAREDPNLFQNSNSPMGFNRSSIVVHKNLSREALEKARVYRGGNHWIKVTFDSYEAAERACFYSPLEIDGCAVHCEMWNNRGPSNDVAIPKGMDGAGELISTQRARTIGVMGGRASAVAGFEQAMGGTLPRSHVVPATQYGQPRTTDDMDASSTTASSATATEAQSTSLTSPIPKSTASLRSRSQPNLPSQIELANSPTSLTQSQSQPQSQFMSRAPKVRKVALRPISEALPPRQSLVERVLRSLPVVNWVLGLTVPSPAEQKGEKTGGGGLIGEGPVIQEDGSWDRSDFCGLKED
ncbi:hypothetical protein LTR51_002327 [Lithohypha guttulata]|nr:hypothetical protein LTR51_002327 [Lithohypha guttulata]